MKDGVRRSVCERVYEDVASVWSGTVPLCNPLFVQPLVFTVSPECLGKQTAHLLMRSSVEYALRFRRRQREKEGEKGERAK